MENCIFCKIANGEIPAATLYEDENFRVILDLGPASKGHALILPKSHAANIYELSDEMAAKAMILAKKMATAMTAALKCDGFNIVLCAALAFGTGLVRWAIVLTFASALELTLETS